MDLQAGITFLAKTQQEDGSFLSLSSPDSLLLTDAILFHSVFSTAIILSSLNKIKQKDKQLDKIKYQAAQFLLTQKSKHWTFNYWTRESQEAQQMPYPDDLDDTFYALTALYTYNPKIFTGTVLAKAISLLTALEVKEGGPYRTWVASSNSLPVWTDVDPIVNTNIAYFLQLQQVELPTLTKFFEKCITENTFISPYYPTIYPGIYFLSRFYKGKYTNKLSTLLFKEQKKDTWSNPLNTALAVLALQNWGQQQLLPAINYLKDSQQSNGAWQATSFYTGVNPKRDKPFYAGSQALTTAFCLEALYTNSFYSQPTKNSYTVLSKKEEMHKKILEEGIRFTKTLNRHSQIHLLAMIQRVTSTDKDRSITLLPFYFAQCLNNRDQKKLSKNFIIRLGFANLLGWIAYTIYDDFYDDEGDKKKLSIANICLREITEIFTLLFPNKIAFHKRFKDIMNGIDNANLWEVTNARFIPQTKINITDIHFPDWGKYELLASRSLGHALGPLAIMQELKQDKQQMQYLINFFHHYLIAKQLNDDSHDIEEDIRKGILTPVVTKLIKRYNQKYNTQNRTLKRITKKLKDIFWYEIIDEVISDISYHTQEARKAAKNIQVIEIPTFYENLLKQLEKTAKIAIEERNQTREFIEAYKG